MTTKYSMIAALFFVFSCVTGHAAQDMHGVKVEDSIALAGTKLQLNGAGTRYRTIFKVYVGALYTTQKVNSLEDLIAAPGPKRISLTFLREIEADPFGKLLTRGVEDNVPRSEFSKLVPGLIRMSDIFSNNKVLLTGDVVHVDWIPGTGMVITAKGKVQGEPFKDLDFYKAIMSIWLGPSPADFKLKEGLLGAK
ncbi:MAG: chalcone isomerase family protein [Rhodoferax sp.]|nr:chalcone isomerase family protein [Rhodoferax sp.]